MKRIIFLITSLFFSLLCSKLYAQGTILWKFPLTAYSCYVPAIGHDGTIFVPSGNTLIAVDPSIIMVDANKVVTNQQQATKWSYTLGDYVNTPTVDDSGNVYIQSQPSGVLKLDSSGNSAWQNAYNPTGSWSGGDCGSNIAIGREGDIYVSRGGGQLHAVHSTDGTQKWVSVSGYSGGTSTPAVGRTGILYSNGSASYRLFSMNPLNGQATNLGSIPSYAWRPSIGPSDETYIVGHYYLYKINADGTAWSPQLYHTGQSVGQSVVAPDGTIYFVSRNSNLCAANPDGTQKWCYASSFYLAGTPAIGNDGIIYVAATNGFIAVTPQGSLDWQMSYLDGYFYSQTWASPVIGPDGTIYIIGVQNGNNNKYLYAISTSSTGPALSSWPMLGANAQHTFQVQVESLETIASPAGGGTIGASPSGPNYVKGTNAILTASASQDWAFGHWEWNDGGSSSTENPMILTINGPETVTAKFFRTFRNAVGSFYDTSGTYGDGECVTYVKHETGITKADGTAFTGNAHTYFQEAITEGYQTGSVPRVGSIIVFAAVPNTNLEYGHVAIVTAINGINVTMEDQNWFKDNGVGIIGQHTVDTNNYNILGYIYYTP